MFLLGRAASLIGCVILRIRIEHLRCHLIVTPLPRKDNAITNLWMAMTTDEIRAMTADLTESQILEFAERLEEAARMVRARLRERLRVAGVPSSRPPVPKHRACRSGLN